MQLNNDKMKSNLKPSEETNLVKVNPILTAISTYIGDCCDNNN